MPTWATSAGGRSRSAGTCSCCPALLLNYFGQAALLGASPESVESPFYQLAPSWGTFPLVVLATLATIIASQAVISGAFSLTAQAVQLDYLPRVKIVHTSPQHIGQIYVPVVNWLLMIGCVGLVLGFRSSSNLAVGVRHRGDGDDADHDAALLPGRSRPLGMVARAGARGLHPVAGRRHRVPVGERPQDRHGRLVPARRRARARHVDDHVAARPTARRRAHPPWRTPDRSSGARGRGRRRRARPRHRGVHVQRCWRSSAGAARQPQTQPRAAPADVDGVGAHVRRAASAAGRNEYTRARSVRGSSRSTSASAFSTNRTCPRRWRCWTSRGNASIRSRSPTSSGARRCPRRRPRGCIRCASSCSWR